MSHNFYAAAHASPYLNEKEIFFKKDYHNNVINILARVNFDVNRHSLLDLGCGNGALLNSILDAYKKTDTIDVCGFDTTQEYIDFANLNKNHNIDFRCKDILNLNDDAIERKFDYVISTGVLPIFEDFTSFFDPCISCLKPGGYLIVNGRINPDPVDVKMQFRDHSHSDTTTWRSDWNVHSEYSIVRKYEKDFVSIKFEEDVLKTEIPRDQKKPSVSTYTFRDEHGQIVQTNGAMIIKNYRFFIGQLKL